MASSALERLVTAGLRATNESRRQVETAVARLLYPPEIARDERVDRAADAEVDEESAVVATDLVTDQIDELEAGVGVVAAGDESRAPQATTSKARKKTKYSCASST